MFERHLRKHPSRMGPLQWGAVAVAISCIGLLLFRPVAAERILDRVAPLSAGVRPWSVQTRVELRQDHPYEASYLVPAYNFDQLRVRLAVHDQICELARASIGKRIDEALPSCS